MTSDATVVVMDVATICNVYDAPAIRIGVDPEDLLTDLRVKSVETGRILACGGILHPLVCDGKVYITLPGFEIGSMVAFGLRTIGHMEMRQWFEDDHEVGLGDFLAGRVACLQEPACNTATEPQETPSEPLTACDGTQEAPEDLPEAEGPEEAGEGLRGGVMGCAAAELRTVLIETMRRQDRAMTVKEIAAILNDDTVDARTRIAAALADMEGKGLVKRGSYVPSQSPGRKSVTTWVVA